VEDAVKFSVEIRNAGSFACTVVRNNGCVSDSVEIHVAGPHGGIEATEYPSCTEAIEEDVLDPGESLNADIMMESGISYGNYAAIASFTDHHNGEASTSFELD
jgi:hypothetical protein